MPGPITDKDKQALADRREELSSAAMKVNRAPQRKPSSASKKSPVGTFFLFLILVVALLAAQKLGFLDRFFQQNSLGQ